MSKKSERWLSKAMLTAAESQARFRHGAVVVVNGKVRATAPNVRKNDPHYVDFRLSSVHAEIAALKRAGFPRRASVYVARIHKDGSPAYSRPCTACQEVLDSLQADVYWTEELTQCR